MLETQAWESRRSGPLLTTKFAIPTTRANMVARTRLTDRLNASPAQRLILVVAPAGWGKTSVVSEWIARQPEELRSVAWVSMDVGDNDLTRFLLYLTAALNTAHPGLGETAHSLLLSPQPAPSDIILTLLLNEISASDRAVTVVLDDYHLITAPPVHEAMTFLLEHLPPSLNLILATRADPPLPLPRMRARGQLLEIRADDLRFTHEEAAVFLNQGMGLNLDAEAIAGLEARTEGWIAGLQLAALSLQRREDTSAFIASFTGSHRYIVDYLFEEVLGRQPEEVQTFLMETSILDRLCATLCEALVGREGGQAVLEMLEAHNLFLIPLDAERRWYRYHHLFADVLRTRLREQGEARVAELHGRASAWYEQQGMVEEAVHQAMEGRHLRTAARLIEENCDQFWLQGGQHTMEQWLKVLPAEWVASRPMLSFMQGGIYAYDLRPMAALAAIDNCEAAAKAEGSWTRKIQGRVAAVRSNIARIQGDFDAAVAFAREALASLSPDNSLWRNAFLFHLGVALYEGNHLSGASQALTEATSESQKVGNLTIVVLGPAAYGQLQEAQGALLEARQTYRLALDYVAECNCQYAGETAILFAGLGRLHYQWNDLTAAETYLNEGLKRRHPALSMACYLELMRLKQAQNDLEGISALMRQMEAAAQQTRVAWLSSAVTSLKVRWNHLDEASVAAWVQAYETRAPDQRPTRWPLYGLREMEDLTWARLRLAQGQTELVRGRLEDLLEVLTRHGCHGNALEYRLPLATLHCQQGQLDRAVTVLEPALTLAAKEGYVRVFLNAGKPLLPVLRECAARGIEPEYVARLLEAFRAENRSPAEKQEQASALIEPLSEREREVLRLLAAGLSNSELAARLFLSVGTVKRHVHNIFLKLEVTNRMHASDRARELNLL
jgi:LuxR family maltose regulon positive regulatory protein